MAKFGPDVAVEIDDFIPCHKKGFFAKTPEPQYAQHKGNEMCACVARRTPIDRLLSMRICAAFVTHARMAILAGEGGRNEEM